MCVTNPSVPSPAACTEIDRLFPYSDMSNHSDIFTRIIELFGDASEDIKSAAAFAAGPSLVFTFPSLHALTISSSYSQVTLPSERRSIFSRSLSRLRLPRTERLDCSRSMRSRRSVVSCVT